MLRGTGLRRQREESPSQPARGASHPAAVDAGVRRFGSGVGEVVDPAALAGAEQAAPPCAQCAQAGCANPAPSPCAYVDRRGRACATSWCADHRTDVDGRHYCRRHAGTIRAIGPEGVASQPLPDVDNRAPSLVRWVADDLDGDVVTILAGHRLSDLDQVAGELVHVGRATDGGRRWERSWKLYDHTGILARVTVSVDESDDTIVTARVGQHPVASATPPWVGHHVRHEDVAPDVDAEERRAFRRRIIDAVDAGVRQDLSAAPRILHVERS